MFGPLGPVPLIFGAYEPVPPCEHPHRSDRPERGSALHGGRDWKEAGGNDGRRETLLYLTKVLVVV